MKKILAFGASNSSTSINRKFAKYAAEQLAGCEVTLLDLREFEMPIYSIDRQNEDGFPEQAQQFLQLIKDHDGIVVSLAEHNHSYTAVFKNLLDWVSRVDGKFCQEKPMLLLSTSPGGRGGANVMDVAARFIPSVGGQVIGKFSLPSFYSMFSETEGILDAQLKKEFEAALHSFAEEVGN